MGDCAINFVLKNENLLHFCKRKTDSISSTYNISHMVYIEYSALNVVKIKTEIQFSIRQNDRTNKKSTH